MESDLQFHSVQLEHEFTNPIKDSYTATDDDFFAECFLQAVQYIHQQDQTLLGCLFTVEQS
jgi:hypothetical protein